MTEWWRPTFQRTIDAFYEGDLAAGLAACERLLSGDGLPEEIELQTHRNLAFYAPTLSDLIPATEMRPVALPTREGWSSFNPSIASSEDELRLIVRSSNYRYHGSVMSITVDDPDGIIRTENYWVRLDDRFDVQEAQLIADAGFRPEPPPFPVAGFEDCRLFCHGASWWATATVRDRDAAGICRTAMLRLDAASVADMRLLSDGRGRHEKNWMPAPGGDAGPRFVYGCSPTVVVRYDDASGAVVPESIQPAPIIARRFSGGSQVLAIADGFLGVVHESARFADGARLYTHRWVWFDAAWRLARLSPPFVFQELGVEFAAGLAQRDDELVISYGVWDREAWLATVPIAEVLSLLAPPLDPDEVIEEMRAEAASAAPEPRATAEEPAPDTSSSILDAKFAPIAPAPRAMAGITPFAAGGVSIVSMTMTGNSEAIVGDALRSVVDWVDRVLVVDTGVSDDTLRIAREIAGEKLVLREFPWRDDFAAARNDALQAAAELGADWAVMLDTDERIELGGVDVRAALAETDATVLHVKHRGGTYGKERFFRLPARGAYVGPTHEAFIIAGGGSGTLDGMLFDELGKTTEQYRQKAERDIAILSRHTAEHPDDPRWRYYLGDSLAGLGRHQEAIAAFRVCANLNGWDEESAWAMYRAAECLLKLDRPVEAIEACAAGMAKHAGMAELPWLAGYAAWHAGRPAQAVYWARQSIALGHYAGIGASAPRIGFRHPPALWEGPYDVLRFALRALGDVAGADEAERSFARAKAARESS